MPCPQHERIRLQMLDDRLRSMAAAIARRALDLLAVVLLALALPEHRQGCERPRCNSPFGVTNDGPHVIVIAKATRIAVSPSQTVLINESALSLCIEAIARKSVA